jgi:biopolymer transport protein ExbD
MNRRRKHHLDLLPLLDVFMTVLFVFATIQERKLDESVHTAEAQQRELAALREQAAVKIDAAELERLRKAAAAAEAAAAEAKAALKSSQSAEDQLRAALADVRQAAEQAAASGRTGGAEALRRQDVLARLLDHFSVFEIEVDGELGEAGVVNHCCYRSEPLAGAWQSCGEIPAATADLATWLAEGGAGLEGALRRTRGGNALTIVRQNEHATWRIGRKLEEQLRERFPDHKIYGEGVALHSLACPR